MCVELMDEHYVAVFFYKLLHHWDHTAEKRVGIAFYYDGNRSHRFTFKITSITVWYVGVVFDYCDDFFAGFCTDIGVTVENSGDGANADVGELGDIDDS